MKLFKTLLAAVALVGAGTGTALAQSDETTFQVRITITESCDIQTTAPADIDFGPIARNTTPAPVEQTGAVNVTCTVGTPYQIGLDGGSNYDTAAGGSITAPEADGRRMALSGEHVPYELYQAAGGTTFWGNVPGTDTTGGNGTGSNVQHAVYARLRGTDPTNVPAGTYVDTVTATVTF